MKKLTSGTRIPLTSDFKRTLLVVGILTLQDLLLKGRFITRTYKEGQLTVMPTSDLSLLKDHYQRQYNQFIRKV